VTDGSVEIHIANVVATVCHKVAGTKRDPDRAVSDSTIQIREAFSPIALAVAKDCAFQRTSPPIFVQGHAGQGVAEVLRIIAHRRAIFRWRIGFAQSIGSLYAILDSLSISFISYWDI
jgi:hypothetical protein